MVTEVTKTTITLFTLDILSNFIGGFLLQLHLIDKPIYIDYRLVLISLVIPSGIFFYIFIKKWNHIIGLIKDLIQRQREGKKIIIILLLLLLFGLGLLSLLGGSTIAQALVPIFEITSPKNNDLVGQTITVAGHGAIPGNQVRVFVIDDLGQKWQGINTTSTYNGDWEIYPVYIGDSSNIQKGKNYSIYAEINYMDREIRTRIIRVIRK